MSEEADGSVPPMVADHSMKPFDLYAVRTVSKHTELIRGFAEVINRASVESDTDTPDFILAEFLADCLRAFGLAAGGLGRRNSQLSGEQTEQLLDGVNLAVVKMCATRAWWHRPGDSDV